MDKLKKLLDSPVGRAVLTVLGSAGSWQLLGLTHPVTFVVALGGVALTVTAAVKK